MKNIIHLCHAKHNKLKHTAMGKKHNALIMLGNRMMTGYPQIGNKCNGVKGSMQLERILTNS